MRHPVGLGLAALLSVAACRDRDAPTVSDRSDPPSASVAAIAPSAVSGAPRDAAPPAPSVPSATDVERRLASAAISSVRASRDGPDLFDAELDDANGRHAVRIELAPPDAPRSHRGAIAFYRLARALELPLVPAAVERSIPIGQWMQGLEASAADPSPRLRVLADGTLDATVFAIGVDATGAHALGQGRRIDLTSSVEVGIWSRWAASFEVAPGEDSRLLRAFVGALVLDYLSGNVLRAGVWLDDDAHTLVLDDNGTAFPPHPETDAVRRALDRIRPIRRFPRELLGALEALDELRIRQLMAPGRFETWLVTPRTRLELLERARTLASLIAARIQRDGESAASL